MVNGNGIAIMYPETIWAALGLRSSQTIWSASDLVEMEVVRRELIYLASLGRHHFC